MPQKNVVRDYKPQCYYHVYNHSVAELKLLFNKYGAKHFLKLFDRYLSLEPVQDEHGQYYKNFSKRLKIFAYCVMPNHYHLLIYQEDSTAIEEFMQSVGTAYAAYFNKLSKRRGAVFESRYKASEITSDEYLLHIIRYIHQNPISLGVSEQGYEYSSHKAIIKATNKTSWLAVSEVLLLFDNNLQSYRDFIENTGTASE
jgi:putative transposase